MFWELQGRENVSFLNKESEKRLIIKWTPSIHIPTVMWLCMGWRPRVLLGARLCLCDRAVWQAPRQCNAAVLVLVLHPRQPPALPPVNATTILLLNGTSANPCS